MRFWSAAVLVFLILAGLGCSPTATTGGKPAPRAYNSIISLSPGTTEILGWLPSSDKLKGRTEACNYPPSTSTVPVVASVKPNYEKIAEIKPDLIVYDAALYSADDISKLKQIGGADLFPMEVNTLDEYVDWLYRLGAKIGAETTISDYVDKVMAARSKALGVPPTPKPKVAVLTGDAQVGYLVAGKKSFVADVVRAGGGDPIGSGATQFEPANIEQLIALNPDVIITSDKAEDVLADARLRSVTAIKSKSVVHISSDVLLRKGQRVDKLILALYNYFAQ